MRLLFQNIRSILNRLKILLIDTSCPDGGFVNCARRSNGRGNAITLPVCGRDVKFTLEVSGVIVLRRPLGYGQVMNVTRAAY